MSIIQSPEFFINIKRVPDISSKEYLAFFAEEQRKIKEGVTINGVRVPGWLYWHINHWKIDVDKEPDPVTKYIERKTQRPFLRDNEWLIAEGMDRAEKNHRGLLILGSRQLGKSEFGASYMGRRAVNFQNSQNIVAGLSEPDLSLLTTKIGRGFMNLHPFFSPLMPLKDWKKRVVLGYKDSNGAGDLHQYSEILIRNLDGGDNTENLAGPTTSALLLDEIGKNDFLEAFIAAKPALETPYGWRASPIFTGTSGSFEKSADLEKFYNNLGTYNFDCIEMLDEHDRKVRFIPGSQASKSKRKKIRLSTFLGKPIGSELDKIAIHVIADKQQAIADIKKARQDFEDAGEFLLAKKETMYYPLNEEELFMTDDSDNPFSDIKELAKSHLAYLESIQIKETYGFMSRDSATGKPIVVPTDKIPVQEFPTGDKEDKDAPIIFYDDPIPGSDFGILHVSGADPYNQDESFYSPSLGTLYIFRRTYDPVNGRFQQRIVASYSARPKITKWQEQCRLLLEYYNATCLPENEESSFIRYFDEKNIGHYLEDGLDLAREINPKTESTRNKGLNASVPNQTYGNTMLKNYCNEDIIVGQDPDGNNIVKKGIIRILDKCLLKEIIAYKPKKGKKKATNVDRIVAFRHALIIAAVKEKYYPLAHVKKIENEKPAPKMIRTPFTSGRMKPFTRATGSSRKRL